MASEKQQQWRFHGNDYDGWNLRSPAGRDYEVDDYEEDGPALAAILNALESDKATAVKALREIAALKGQDVFAANLAQAALDALEARR